MARLLLLNGSPGMGRSTLAQIYVDEHPGDAEPWHEEVRRLVQRTRAGRAGRRRAYRMAPGE